MSTKQIWNAMRQVNRDADRPAIVMKTSVFSGSILLLYRLLNCQRRWRIGRLLLAIVFRLEGGKMQSTTARRIMEQYHGVQIGAYSYGPCFDPALVPPGVSIGRYVSIAPNARFITQNHPLDRLSTHPVAYESSPGNPRSADFEVGSKEIGNDVWIGYNAVLTPGCTKVGTGAVIGAGAVVTRDVPDFCVVAGNPARVIKERFSPEVKAWVANSKWWTAPAEEVPHFSAALRTKRKLSVIRAIGVEQTVERTPSPIASIVIPAHNEESVIGKCLKALLKNAHQGELEVVVVANGCNDGTAKVARSIEGVRVLETSRPSKIGALNLGDRTASVFPRIYLDADVEMGIHSVRELVDLFQQSKMLAGAPRICWDLTHSNCWVRAFYRIWRRQPYFSQGHIGSGVYAVSREGHHRLNQFPELTADDEFVRRLFSASERGTTATSTFKVTAPRTLSGLISIKTRSRRGNLELDKKHRPKAVGGRSKTLWFMLGIAIRPALWPSALVYAVVVLRTSIRARASLADATSVWERDLSSRRLSA